MATILQELLTLLEEKPIELRDVLEYFPKHHGKALEKLWGGSRLMWHGDRFFANNELGPAYEHSLNAATEFMKNDYETNVNMDIEDSEGDVQSMEFDVHFNPEDGQECYLGYSPKHDTLLIGFDIGVSEDEFNEAFDNAFKEHHGEEHDMDHEDHQKIFSKVWEDYKRQKYNFWGVLFEITHGDNSQYVAEEAFPPMPGGFYGGGPNGMYQQVKRHYPDVVNLRLD
jgi:hypothetical protein